MNRLRHIDMRYVGAAFFILGFIVIVLDHLSLIKNFSMGIGLGMAGVGLGCYGWGLAEFADKKINAIGRSIVMLKEELDEKFQSIEAQLEQIQKSLQQKG